MVSALELVKKQILLAISSLSVPTNRKLDEDELEAACSAAKMLRNRLLRETVRVNEAAKELRQMIEDGMADREAVEDGEGDDTNWENDLEEDGEHDLYERHLHDSSSPVPKDRTNQLYRHEFVFLGEMMVMERIVLPLLLAHGMQYPDSLLPQLLKLITAMLSPIPRFSLDKAKQHDLLQRIRNRCAADEFFAVLIQAIAPIAEKRKEKPLSEEEGMLLELVLTLLSNLTCGRRDDIEPVVGALCRNHGMELLLVVVNQNHMKLMQQHQECAEEVEDFAAFEAELATNPAGTENAAERETNDDPTIRAANVDSTAAIGDENDAEHEVVAPETVQCDVALEETLVILAEEDDTVPSNDNLSSFPSVVAAVGATHDETTIDSLNSNENGGDVVVDPDAFAPLSDYGSSDGDDEPSEADDVVHSASVVSAAQDSTKHTEGGKANVATITLDDGAEEEEEGEEEEAQSMESGEDGEDESRGTSHSSETDDDQPSRGVVLQDAAHFIFGGENEGAGDAVENSEALQRWNDLSLKCISFILNCVSPIELAQLRCNADLSGKMTSSSTDSPAPISSDHPHQNQQQQERPQARGKSSTGNHSYFQSDFANHKREIDNLRLIARSRNGATVSSGLLVRNENENNSGTHGYSSHRRDERAGGFGEDANSSTNPGSWAFRRTIGSINSVYGLHHHNPIDVAQELDLKKRGRFVKGMYEENRVLCNLPLPTKLSLAYQCEAFLCHGFEPLTEMVWPLLRQTFSEMEQEIKENREISASFRGSGETMEIGIAEYGAVDDAQRAKIERVLQFMNIASSLLRFTREALRLAREHPESVKIDIAAHCKPLSHILTLDYIQGGLNFYAMCTSIKYIKNNSQLITVVISYVGEMLLLLQQFLHGGIVDDAAIHMAAQALASTILYKEENIAAIFLHLPDSPQRRPPAQRVQSTILLLHAAFSLMEACSFNGALMLPKRKAPVSRKDRKGVADEADADEADIEDKEESEASDQDNEEEDDFIEIERRDEEIAPADLPEVVHENVDAHVDGAGEHVESAPGVEDENSSPLETNTTLRLPSETADEVGSSTDDNIGKDRAASVSSSHPSSVHPSSSVNTATSSLASEREVSVTSFVQRLASVRYIGIVLFGLQSWRINDVDVNLGLVFLLNRIMARHIGVLMNAPFLIAMRDVIQHGKRTHRPLYDVCDSIVYLFFNPEYARNMDEQWMHKREREYDQLSHMAHDSNDGSDSKGAENVPKLAGVSSFFGFEVALRCVRSLFTINATDYRILEEKIMSGLTTGTEIDLPTENYTLNSVSEVASPEIANSAQISESDASADENDERSADSSVGSLTSREAATRGPLHDTPEGAPKKRKRSLSNKKHKHGTKRKAASSSSTKKSKAAVEEFDSAATGTDYALLSYYGNNVDPSTSVAGNVADTSREDPTSDGDDVAFLLRN